MPIGSWLPLTTLTGFEFLIPDQDLLSLKQQSLVGTSADAPVLHEPDVELLETQDPEDEEMGIGELDLQAPLVLGVTWLWRTTG